MNRQGIAHCLDSGNPVNSDNNSDNVSDHDAAVAAAVADDHDDDNDQGFLGRVLCILTQYGREITHFNGQRCVKPRILFVGNCVLLCIKNWHKA